MTELAIRTQCVQIAAIVGGAAGMSPAQIADTAVRFHEFVDGRKRPSPRSKLDYAAIRADYLAGMTMSTIGHRHGCSKVNVFHIVHGRTR